MRIPVLVLATLAGFVGGAIGSHLTTAQAQGPGPGADVLRSKSFVLLDGAGRKRGEWTVEASGQAVIRLFDAQGRAVWDTTGTPRAQPLNR